MMAARTTFFDRINGRPGFKMLAIVLGCMLASLGGCASDNVEQSVVRILLQGPGKLLSGTGFVVAKGGYVATNYHIVKPAKNSRAWRISVYPEGAKSREYTARVRWISPEHDLAILKVPDLRSPPVTLNESELAREDKVRAIGFPAVADTIDKKSDAIFISTRTLGYVNRIVNTDWRDAGTKTQIVQHTASINKGNSGGPLINACGEVVGINMALVYGDVHVSNPTGNRPIQLNVGRSTYFASHASELARFLRSRRINADITTIPCTPLTTNMIWTVSILLSSLLSALAVFYLLRRYQLPRSVREFSERISRSQSRFSNSFFHRFSKMPPQQPKTIQVGGPNGGENFTLLPVGGNRQLVPLLLSMDQARADNGILIGRQPADGTLTIDNPEISRNHARITVESGGAAILLLEDLGSTNGTQVNGVFLDSGRKTPISSGDHIQFGSSLYSLTRHA